jgi:predicted GIY-YIG superfamily endonuclease
MIGTPPTDMPKSTATWWVYIVRCVNGHFYTGITTDTERRLKQHNAGTASKYTRSRRPVKLVYRQSLPDQSLALQREGAIKSLNRKAKEKLIEEQDSASRLPTPPT